MTNPDPLEYCPCCGHDKPRSDYRFGARICSLCSTLTAGAAVELTRETVRRETAIATQTRDGRKRARVAARLEGYRTAGKRCTACHFKKPAEAYNKCAPQPDGLQPICRGCNELRCASLKAGGLATWRTVRDALRAASPEGK